MLKMKKLRHILYTLRAPLLLAAACALMLFAVMPELRSGDAALAAATPAPTEAPAETPVPGLEPAAGLEQTAATAQPDGAVPVVAPANGGEPIALKYGDEAPEVAELQQRLMDLCYMDQDETTEFFGNATKSAVELFQTLNYLPVTGVADELTLGILYAENAAEYTLSRGFNNSSVTDVQERLTELGYYSDKVNGYFGVATEAAVKAFQTKNKLTVTGTVDMDTLDSIMSPNAKPAVDPTPTPKPTKKVTTPRPTVAGATASPTDPPVSRTVEGFIAMAKAQLGDKYVRGDEGPDTFDCSGLVHYCLNHAGVSIGRYSAASYAEVSAWERIDSIDDLRAGDLVFFRSASSSRISHTAIYLGGGQYIHASSSAGKVIISNVSTWFRENFVLGRRVFGG